MNDFGAYAEVGGYLSLGHDFLTALGEHDTAGELKTMGPYWRLAYDRQNGDHVVEVGTFGLYAPLKPNRTGPGENDNYTDVGLDASYQFLGYRHTATVNAAWIDAVGAPRRLQRLGNAGKAGHDLDDLTLALIYYYRQTYGATLALFDIFGTKDTTLYGPGAIGGSRNGNPTRAGSRSRPTGCRSVSRTPLNPYLNLKLGAQFTHYFEFNGSSSNYDGSGSDAGDNDTVFLFAWLGFLAVSAATRWRSRLALRRGDLLRRAVTDVGAGDRMTAARYTADLAAMAAEAQARGETDRRRFLRLCGAGAVTAAAMRARGAMAAMGQIRDCARSCG